MRNQIISHDGVVQSVEGELVRVRILQSSACSGCAEAKEKLVEVLSPVADSYRVGQEVVLEGRLSDGRRAAIIAYGLPLVFLLLALAAGVVLTGRDAVGALCALMAVAVYYAVIFLFFRERLQQTFSFRIKH